MEVRKIYLSQERLLLNTMNLIDALAKLGIAAGVTGVSTVSTERRKIFQNLSYPHTYFAVSIFHNDETILQRDKFS